MTAILSTQELERIILGIAGCKQDEKKPASGQKIQALVRDGLGVLLHLHKQYIEQCKTASGASKKVAEQKTSYEKSLLALQNKRFAPCCLRCGPSQVVVHPPSVTARLPQRRVEKLFYERMINANRAYKSKFSDEDVDLLAEHDFHARQSTQDQASLATADETPHETMKRRLQDEYEQREVLQNEKVAMEKQVQALQVSLIDPALP